ncbi:hypothetical protein [Nostoc sp. CENA543]|nr:hypothetical protein [Nostoc sp. CENA543]
MTVILLTKVVLLAVARRLVGTVSGSGAFSFEHWLFADSSQ